MPHLFPDNLFSHVFSPSPTFTAPIRQMLLVLLLFGNSIVDVLSAPDLFSSSTLGKRSYGATARTSAFSSGFSAPSSSTPVPPTSTLFHSGRQCEWRESGQQCTQNTQDVNVALCSIHGAQIAVLLCVNMG